jgi:hypothetical protein
MAEVTGNGSLYPRLWKLNRNFLMQGNFNEKIVIISRSCRRVAMLARQDRQGEANH